MTTRMDVTNRQSRILHPRLEEVTALVAGAGMIGSWAALALVRAVGGGVHVWDDDVIEDVNVGVQAYDGNHVGMFKADALSLIAQEPPITPHVGRFPETAGIEWDTEERQFYTLDDEQHDVLNTVVICAVDSMAGRREIAEWSRENGIPLFIETGVHAELVVVKTCASPEDYEQYLSRLPGDDDVEEAQCGLKGTAYAGMSLASQIVPLINNWASERPLPRMRLFHTGFFLPIDGPAEGEEGASEN